MHGRDSGIVQKIKASEQASARACAEKCAREMARKRRVSVMAKEPERQNERNFVFANQSMLEHMCVCVKEREREEKRGKESVKRASGGEGGRGI